LLRDDAAVLLRLDVGPDRVGGKKPLLAGGTEAEMIGAGADAWISRRFDPNPARAYNTYMSSFQATGLDAQPDVFALVEGSSHVLAGSLAPDVRTWLASPEQGLSAAIESVSGVEASCEALGRLAPSSLTVVASVQSARAYWAEITRHADADAETCLAGLSYQPGGRVSRVLWLRAPLVPPCQLGSAERVSDARPVLEAYFEALMSSRFREAAAYFTADTLYSHPPYAGGTERVLFHGRDALAHGFETERGPSPTRQIITDLWQQGSRVFVEGVIEGIPDGGTFFSTAEISREGEIARYVAFYSATPIPRG
jgi:SnoaL-like domain